MKKAIGLFTALILALSMSGIAYAHWSEVLTITGVVETGEVCLEFTDVYVEIDQDKEVASVEYDLIDTDGDGSYDKLELDLLNTYPCCWIYIEIDIHNCGSIPVHLTDWGFTSVVDPDGLLPFIDECYWVDGPDGFPPQIHPCETITIYKYIHIMQEDGAGNTCPEDAELTYTYELDFIQWNLAP